MTQQLEEGISKTSALQSHLNHFPQRYVIGVICSIGAVVTVAARDCTSSVLDELVRAANISLTDKGSQCPKGPGEDLELHFHGAYQWSEELQKFILLSFYIGYLVTHVPMGMVSERYGAKWPFLISVIASSITIALFPIVIEVGEQWGLVGVSILLGITQGGLTPAVAVILARWFPPNEHSRFGALMTGSGVLGNAVVQIVAHPLTGYFHWSVVYYSCAGLGLVYCIVFVIFVYSTPETHHFISQAEKDILEPSALNVTPLAQLAPVPWKAMFSSLPVWAYIISHVGHDWVLYGMLLNMPIYLHDVLRFTHINVVIWSALPVIISWITAVCWGFFSDYLIKKGLMELNDLRKMNTMIASFGTGLFLLFCSYARCHHFLVIVFFTLCMCTTGVFFSGAKLNSIDLCPNYAGTLMGISNGLGSVGAMAPGILNIVTRKSTLAEWRNIFWIDFSIIISTAIIYLLFGSSKTQKWNFPNRGESI